MTAQNLINLLKAERNRVKNQQRGGGRLPPLN